MGKAMLCKKMMLSLLIQTWVTQPWPESLIQIAMVIRIDLDYFSAWLKSYKNLHFRCVSNSSTRKRPEFLRLTQSMKDMVLYTDFNNEFNTVIYESLFPRLLVN